MKEKFINYYMKMAELTAELSYAKRLQVGAVIVKNQQVIGTGYNGTPAGWDNDCEDKEWCSGGGWLSAEEIMEGWPYEGTYLDSDGNEMVGRYRLKTKPETLHSEMNALMKVARSTESSEGATLFCTHAPCIDCAKAIYQAGIRNVYFRNHYRDDNGLKFLEKSGVSVTNYK
jgi:dCMP deaminase